MSSSTPSSPSPAPTPGGWWQRPWAWVTTTYFGEGFPYTIVNSAADALFTVMGLSLSSLGLTAILHLPWNLKFLWGPFVDQYETKRRWLVGFEVILCVLLAVLTAVGDVDTPAWIVAAVFMVIAMGSATHDIAVDGYYLEALEPEDQSRYVGYRAAAYRLAMLAINGPLLVLADLQGWRIAWLVSLGVMIAMTAYHAWALPAPEARGKPISELLRRMVSPRALLVVGIAVALGLWGYGTEWWGLAAEGSDGFLSARTLPGIIGLGLLIIMLAVLAVLSRVQRWLDRHDSEYARSFVVFLAQPRVRALLAFVLLFRTGESFLQKMRWPFLHRELDVSLATYGFANGTVGMVSTFVATLLGGYLIAKHGLRRWIWPFVIAQNVLNLLYAGLAFWPQPEQIGLGTITVIITIEHFGAGLGTAVFMVYIMRCCNPDHKAAHMALLTALMSIGFFLAGLASGTLAEALGYGPYFALTFVVTIPSMLLIAIVPHLDERTE
ncbi:MAG: MFS transporter [Myxococcota bacterium]